MVAPALRADATVTSDSVAAAQLLFGLNVLPPWTTRAPVDLGAAVALYGLAGGDRAQSRAFYVRQHVLHAKGGFWGGAAIAQIDRAASFASSAFDVGAWVEGGRRRLTAIVSTTATNDREIFQSTSLVPDEFADHVRVADVNITLEYLGQRASLEGNFGARVSLTAIEGSSVVGSATLAIRVAHAVRLTFSGGKQLADPLRGVPEWRFGSVGLRISSMTPKPETPAGRPGPDLRVHRVDSGRVRFVISAPSSASRVEINGTFSGWSPVELKDSGSGWEIELPVTAGAHRVQVRVDGGEWRAPGNLRVVGDEYGRRVGLLVVAY